MKTKCYKKRNSKIIVTWSQNDDFCIVKQTKNNKQGIRFQKAFVKRINGKFLSLCFKTKLLFKCVIKSRSSFNFQRELKYRIYVKIPMPADFRTVRALPLAPTVLGCSLLIRFCPILRLELICAGLALVEKQACLLKSIKKAIRAFGTGSALH